MNGKKDKLNYFILTLVHCLCSDAIKRVTVKWRASPVVQSTELRVASLTGGMHYWLIAMRWKRALNILNHSRNIHYRRYSIKENYITAC